MNFKHYAAAVGLALMASSAVAQQFESDRGFLYYVAGGVAAPAQATTEDGTLTTDNGVFSVLVADVAIGDSDLTVSNWRYAAGADIGNPLPEDNPSTGSETEAYAWMFLENSCHVYNGYLYVGPGDWNSDGSRDTAPVVAFAEINTDGTLGAWSLSDIFPTVVADQAIGASAFVDFGSSAYYYVLGGTSANTDRVIVAPLLSTGGVGAWSATTPLPAADWFNRATAVGDTVIHATGNGAAALRTIHYATANSADGTLGAWTSGGQYDTGAKQWDMAMASVESDDGSDFAVIAGGSALDGKVFVSEVTAGVPGAWTETNALPTSVRRVAGNGFGDVIFVLGGTNGGSGISLAIDDVQVGRVDDAGVITWSTSDSDPNIAPMPQGRGFGGTAFHFVDHYVPLSAEKWSTYE